MHEIVFYIAFGWSIALFCVCVVMVARAKSGLVRALSLDTLTLVLIGMLIMHSAMTGSSWYLDGALVLALISFIGVIVAARYHAERRIFR